MPFASSRDTVTGPAGHGSLSRTAPPTSLVTVTGLTVPPASAADTVNAPLARSRMKCASLVVGQSASPNSRMVPDTLCMSIESTASMVPDVSIPPPLCATVRFVARNCALTAASSLPTRSAAGQPTRAAIGNSLGNPLFLFCQVVTPHEFICCRVSRAICSCAASPPTNRFSPGKTEPSMLMGWSPGLNRAVGSVEPLMFSAMAYTVVPFHVVVGYAASRDSVTGLRPTRPARVSSPPCSR